MDYDAIQNISYTLRKSKLRKIEIKNVTIDVIIDPLDKCGNEKEVSQGTKRNPDVLSCTCTKDPTEKNSSVW